MGYMRIKGECRKLGIAVAATTVKKIVKEASAGAGVRWVNVVLNGSCPSKDWAWPDRRRAAT